MDQARFAFQARAVNGPLSLKVTLNDSTVLATILDESQLAVEHVFDDAEVDYKLAIEMSGKLPEHTVIDNTGNIVLDRYIEITNFTLENVPLGHAFTEHARYYHDLNGSAATQQDRFYGYMGCNGQVIFEFHGPVYLWLLENM